MQARSVIRLGGILMVLSVAGCTRTPQSIRHVPASDLTAQHPACLQQRNSNPPKAFLIKNDAALKQLWGPGEDPPVVSFEKNMLLVAFTSLSSEGPGTMEVWVLKYGETEDVMEVRVREDVGGSWPLSTGFSRAYDIVAIPHTTKPVRVLWQYLWGARNEQRELRAEEWVPKAGGGTGGWGNQSGGDQGWPTAAQQPH